MAVSVGPAFPSELILKAFLTPYILTIKIRSISAVCLSQVPALSMDSAFGIPLFSGNSEYNRKEAQMPHK